MSSVTYIVACRMSDDEQKFVYRVIDGIHGTALK